MAIDDRIECLNCRRAVVPHLWVDTRDQMMLPTVRHLCPLCGATLRVSGGGVDRSQLISLIVLVGINPPHGRHRRAAVPVFWLRPAPPVTPAGVVASGTLLRKGRGRRAPPVRKQGARRRP